jgi:xylulokinase
MTKASGLKIDPTMSLGEGGAKSAIWRQIICDICNVRGKFITEVLGAPVGDAVCAGVGVGQFSNYGIVKKWGSPFKIIDPIPENYEKYTKLYEIYLKLYPAVKDLYDKLAILKF